MNFLTKNLVWLGDVFFAFLAMFSPTVILWIISALMGVVMLLVWRYTSNQEAIADVRRKISAHLLASRLFKDDLSVTFRAQRQIIWQALRLLLHSIRPMLIMTVPFVLVMAQIGLRYEHRAVMPRQSVRVKATLKRADAVMKTGCELQLPGGITADPGDPCRVTPLRTVDWRLRPDNPGAYRLSFGSGSDIVEMPLIVGARFPHLSSIRGGSFFERLLYSAEPSIPESSVFESIEVYYPKRSTPIFGWDVHWLISLLVLSILFALIFKPFLKVHI